MKKKKFWKNKKFISLAVLFIVGAFAFGLSIVRADPVVYYFNNAVNTSPAEQGNYWYDEFLTDPALELPNFAVDHVTVTGGVIFDGDGVFRGNSINYGEVTGNAIFYDTALNDALVDGNAEFFGTSTHGGNGGGIIVGNAIFNDDSQSTTNAIIQGSGFFYDNAVDNGSPVGVDATFYGDVSDNTGDRNGSSNVTGTQTRYYDTPTVTVRNFILVGPWTVVADGVEVDVTGATFDGSTTFSAINGGSFIGADAPVTYYFSNAVNTDPTEVGNYWLDPDCTMPAGGTPIFAVDEVFIGGCSSSFSQVIFDGDAILNVSATNEGTITGNAVFNDNSSNISSGMIDGGQGTVEGNAVFNDASLNNSVVEGSAEFYDTAENFGDGFTGGEIQGNAVFHDSSRNRATLAVDGVFNDSSESHGSINGDATFNDSSQLAGGTVIGDATFNGDLSDIPVHGGSVSGTKTRRYITNIATSRNFTLESPWTVLADGAIVNLTTANFNGTTTFATLNGGSFVFPTPVISTAVVKAKKLTLTYNRGLDNTSVPATSDYLVLVNGIPVSVSIVSVTGSTVILTLNLSENASLNDVIIVDYTPGVNPVRIGVGAEAAALNDQATTITSTVTIGGGVIGDILAVGTTVYVAASGTIAVVDTSNLTVSSFINVISNPRGLTLSGTKLYALNSGSNRVSVIDTLTNTVSATIVVANAPYGAALVGNKLYVANNSSSSVSVINTLTNTVVGTISVGSGPRNPVLVGTKLYVNNFSGSSVSVIDTLTDTVSTTISVGSSPQSMARIGSKLYVVNSALTTIKVIDLTSDTVVSTITSPGSSFRSTTVFRNKLYVTDSANNQVVIVDSNTDTIVGTIATSTFPNTSALIDNRLLIGAFNGGAVSIIDPLTDTIINNIASASTVDFTNIGSTVYISNQPGTSLTITNLKALISQLPNLVSFSSSAASGRYVAGQTIGISATFARALQAGSTMTVSLNTGASVVLNSVSGGTLSGTYTIGSGETTPDLAVTAITSVSVTDLEAHTRTSYSLNSSITASDPDNLSIVRNIGDGKNIVVGTYTTMATGQQPQYISPVVTVDGIEYLYVTNKTDNTVSAIRKSDGVTTATITVGTEPTGISSAVISGVPTVYVANASSNTVSVINATTNTVSSTISVGARPSHFEMVNSKLYVSNNGSHTVSVINTATNTVTATIAVGLAPRGLKALGTKLYVANYGDLNISGGNNISVIDTVTDTVSDTILLPVGSAGNYGIAIYSRNLYLTNYLNNTVSVIDADTKTLEATISLSGGPRDIILANGALYVSAFDGGTIWSIDSSTNLETAIIIAGHSPMGMISSGNFLYYTRYQDNLISLINLSNNTVSTVLSETTSSGGGGGITINQTPPSEPPIISEPETPGGPSSAEPNPPQGPIDIKLSNRLKGRLLLAVFDHGKIWYVDTVNANRYQVTVANALDIFRRLSLGITNTDLFRVPVADSSSPLTTIGNRLKGKLLLQVENRGVIWYVDMNGRRHLVTLGNILDLFRKLSLGITNENLDKIKIGDLN